MASEKITALITGFDGFVGPFLAEHLIAHKRRVFGTVYRGDEATFPTGNLRVKKVTILPVDLVDYEDVRKVIRNSIPDEVYHLAGISHVPTSWNNPRLTFSTNVMGTVNLLEALREAGREVKVLAVSSAEVYGSPRPGELPTRETTPLRPESPYATSKAALDLLARQWSQYPGFYIIRARPFSHTGPGQRPDFVCPGFARQVAAISLGLEPPVMKVGDLSARRDFLDVRDVARAYHLLSEKGGNGEVYNICSGRSRSIKGILQTLKSFCDEKIRVETDPERLRPSDIPETRGSCAKLKRTTGWRPEIPFSKTLRDLYQYWRYMLEQYK